MMKKQVNMGITDPFNTKEKKSEFTKVEQEKSRFERMKERDEKDKEKLEALASK